MVDEKLVDAQVISPGLVRDVEVALRAGESVVAIALIREFHAADIADLMEALPSELRDVFVAGLGQDLNPEMLAELDELRPRSSCEPCCGAGY
jgi:Mg/Co/Ni transporter MgtE